MCECVLFYGGIEKKEELKCPICGDVTSSYMGKTYRADRLCRKHANDFKNGKIERCDKCGEWHATDKPCLCDGDFEDVRVVLKEKGGHKCPICDSLTKNKFICNDCYKISNSHLSMIDKNITTTGLNDYYFNLKNYIYRSEYSDEKIFQSHLIKLFTLADLNKKIYHRDALFNKVFDDITDIKTYKNNKQQKENKKETSVKEKIDKYLNTPGVKRAIDGHFVKSDGEETIDNLLFRLKDKHVYEQVVTQITERTVVCDWYIYITDEYGIYVELWGIDKDYNYNLNKEEKRALYKKHDLPLIEIEKDEVYGDSAGLLSRIKQQVEMYKEEIRKKI